MSSAAAPLRSSIRCSCRSHFIRLFVIVLDRVCSWCRQSNIASVHCHHSPSAATATRRVNTDHNTHRHVGRCRAFHVGRRRRAPVEAHRRSRQFSPLVGACRDIDGVEGDEQRKCDVASHAHRGGEGVVETRGDCGVKICAARMYVCFLCYWMIVLRVICFMDMAPCQG